MTYAISRSRYYDVALQEWQLEAVAGSHGKAFIFDTLEEALDMADLINQCQVGAWEVKSFKLLEGRLSDCLDNADLQIYKADLRKFVAQRLWFEEQSSLGYIVIPVVEDTRTCIDVDGSVELRLLEPWDEERNKRVECFTKQVAIELAEYANARNHCAPDVCWTYMAVEAYQRHWNRHSEIEMASPEVVASLLAEVRDYMGTEEGDHATIV